MKYDSNRFMVHFRWITPLLLAFSVYMLQSIYNDFRELREDEVRSKVDMATLKADIAVLKAYLMRDLNR